MKKDAFEKQCSPTPEGNEQKNVPSAKRKIRWIPIVAGAVCLCLVAATLLWFRPWDNRQVPVYQGMTVIGKAPAVAQDATDKPLSLPFRQFSSKSLSLQPPMRLLSSDTDLSSDAISESTETEAETAPNAYAERPLYFAKKNQDAYLTIHVDNPDGYEILSFTLNGTKYTSYMFEAGSDLENLILKVNVGDVEGISEYTIDAIKYVDGTIIKDVRMNGDRTVWVGVYGDTLPQASFTKVERDFHSLTLDLSFDSRMSFLSLTAAKVHARLYIGETQVGEQSLVFGENTGICFEGLSPNTEYLCTVEVECDLLDGEGLRTHTLSQRTLRTRQALSFQNLNPTKTGATFELVWAESYPPQEITAISLYHKDTKVKEIDPSARSVEGLMSSTSYQLEVSYLSGSHTRTERVSFSTQAMEIPSFDELSLSVDKTSVTFTVTETDPDGIGEVSEIELSYADGKTICTVGGDIRRFDNLQSDTSYVLAVFYTYDRNDGKGPHSSFRQLMFRTGHHTPPRVEVTSATADKSSIHFELVETDPENMGVVSKIELIPFGGDPIVAENTEIREFTNLMSDTQYIIWVTYVMNLNDGRGDQIGYASKQITTQAKAIPSMSIPSATPTQTGIDFVLTETDPDDVGTVSKIELLHGNDAPIVAESPDIRSFSGLLSNNNYTLKVTYVYNLNDGEGDQSITRIWKFNTRSMNVPTLSIESSSAAQDSVDFTFVETDPDNTGAMTKAELLLGGEVVQTKTAGETLHFEGLIPLTEYQIVITYEYDLNDGGGVHTKTISRYQFSGLNRSQGLIVNSRGEITGIGSCMDEILYIDGNLLRGVFRENSRIKSVYIGTGVTSIEDSAFRDCGRLTTVYLPDTLIDIGHSAFFGCDRLTEIAIPSGVTQIREYTFRDCSKLSEVTLPVSITHIGTNAFFGCSNLTEITLPTDLTQIGSFAFYGCAKLTEIVIPSGVSQIGGSAFANCSALSRVTLPSALQKIESSTFSGCGSLLELSLPTTLRSIGDYAFSNCSSLTELDLPNGLLEIGSGAFSGCSGLSEMIIPDGVIELKASVFQNCSGLVSIRLPDELFAIGRSAFAGCTKLLEIVIPQDVTELESNVFQGCTALGVITLPADMSEIGNAALSGCNGLTKIIFLGTEEEWLAITKASNWDTQTSLYVVECLDKTIEKNG